MRTVLKRKKLLLILAVLAAAWMWRLAGDVSQRRAEIGDMPDPILRGVQLDKRRAGPDRARRPGLEQDVIEIYEADAKHTLDDPPTDVPPIILKLPEKFRASISKGAVRDWGAYILTYYPSFTSPRDPENAKYGLSCVGYCNGQILVSIENIGRNAPGSINPKAQFQTDYLARYVLGEKNERKYPQFAIPHILDTDLPPQAGFDIVFEELNTADDDAKHIRPSCYKQIERFYIHKNKKFNYFDFFVQCQVPSGDNHFEQFLCELHFTLACNPAVYVKVSIVGEQIVPELLNIRAEVEQFVSGMIVKPECKREP